MSIGEGGGAVAAFQHPALPEPIARPAGDESSVDARSLSWRADSSGSRVASVPTELRFGRFRLVPGARLLLRDGDPVGLGSRAFDLLHVLLTWRGNIVAKETLVRHVWPTTMVEESNLRFQMASLRKALGADGEMIKTIPGRGYLFAEDVDAV